MIDSSNALASLFVCFFNIMIKNTNVGIFDANKAFERISTFFLSLSVVLFIIYFQDLIGDALRVHNDWFLFI